jgi:hypothetical protein
MIINESVAAGESMMSIRIAFDPMINPRTRPELYRCVMERVTEIVGIGPNECTICLDGVDYHVAYQSGDDGTGAHIMVSIDPALVG